MNIVLDTNAFCADFHFKGRAARLLREAVSRLDVTLCVPSVVIDEVVRQYREQLTQAIDKLQAPADKINHLLDRQSVKRLSRKVIDEAVLDYRAQLASRLKAWKAKILPYPTVSAELASRRILERRRPFASSEAGFRDYVIWLSVVDLLSATTDVVVFISANTKDFLARTVSSAEEAPQRPNVFHNDLLKDLSERGIGADRVQWFGTIDSFCTANVEPELARRNDIVAEINEEKLAGFSLRSWADTDLEELLRSYDDLIAQVNFSVPEDTVRFGMVGLTKVQRIEAEDVRLLNSGELVVTVIAEIVADLSIHVDYEDYLHSLEVRQLVGESEGDEAWSSSSWSEDVSSTLTLKLVLDPKTHAVLSAEVGAAEGRACGITIG